MSALDRFTEAYVICALWSSTDDNGEPLDTSFGAEDIAPDTLAKMIEDCRRFQIRCESLLLDIDDEQAGHDFWLTRNRHGAGFWDRGLGRIGEWLTSNAHAFGEVFLYIGKDGKIHA